MPGLHASQNETLSAGTPASEISIADILRNVNDPNGKLVVDKYKATVLSAESSTSWLEQLKNCDFDVIICNSEIEVKKIRRGSVSVPLAFLINAWYSVNDPGFGSL